MIKECSKCKSKKVVKGHKPNEYRCLDCGLIMIEGRKVKWQEQE